MKKSIIGLTTAFLMLIGSQALAQDTLLEHLVKSCETDLENYCSQVTPGEGRLLHCMAAHADKISGRCEYAFYQAATLLEQVAAAVTYLATECKTDIETHCADVEMGEGRVLACLEANAEEVSDACKNAIADTIAD